MGLHAGADALLQLRSTNGATTTWRRCSRPTGSGIAPDKSLKGAAILEALNARSRTQTVRHVLTNIQVDVADASSADFILYVTAYMHDSGTKATKPPKITSPYLLLVVPGTLVKLGDDWKIASMSMNREFEF